MLGVTRSLVDPMTWFQIVRLLHYYGYSHVVPRRRLTLGPGATLAPNVSLRNGERIVIGAGSKVGERAYLWAGDSTGRITIGENCRLGPEVFVTASDYGRMPDRTSPNSRGTSATSRSATTSGWARASSSARA